jgi:hypothetical protein
MTDKIKEQPPVKSKRRKKKGPMSWIIRILLLPFFIFLIGLIISLGLSALDHKDPLDYMPGEILGCVKVSSVENLLGKLLSLDAADIMLASGQWADIRKNLVDLRSMDIWANPIFQYLIGIPMDLGLYDDDQILLAANMKLSAAPIRLALPLVKWFNISFPGLESKSQQAMDYFSFSTANPERPDEPAQTIYFAFKGNLFFLSTAENLLLTTLGQQALSISRYPVLNQALQQQGTEDIRILIKTESILEKLEDGPVQLKEIISYLEFPDYSSLAINISNEEISLSLELPVDSSHQGLKELLNRRNGAPAVLSDLPESVEYASIISLGSPQELMAQLGSLMGEDLKIKLQQAEQASQLMMKMSLEELLYSWIGEEWGVYGMKSYPEPIFFLRVADEKTRQEVFQSIFSRFFISQQENIRLEDQQLQQMQLPWFIQSIIKAFKVDLPEPYFVVRGDFIYFSNSAEALAHSLSSSEDGDLLVKTELWDEFSRRISPSASFEIFYSLKRSIPFFLKGQGPVVDSLKLYNQGMATLQFRGDNLLISLSAMNTGESGILAYPGFPLERQKRLGVKTIALTPNGQSTRLYWLEGKDSLVEYHPASGEFFTAQLNDQAWIMAQPNGESLWAVTERGAIYRYGPKLELRPGYPRLTGLRISCKPALWRDSLILAEKEDNSLYILKDQQLTLLRQFQSPVLSVPAISQDGLIAVYPKGFLGELHIFNTQGTSMEGWPVKAPGISYGSPFFIPQRDKLLLGFLTQAGKLTIFDGQGQILEETDLQGVFYQTPLWSPVNSTLYMLSESGELIGWSPGNHITRTQLEDISGEEAHLNLMDLQEDGSPEILVSRGGAVILGFSENLTPLDGFPITGGQDPLLADLNGDGKDELITGGYDKSLRAYTLP